MKPPSGEHPAALKYLPQAAKTASVSVSFLSKRLLGWVGLSTLLLVPIAVLAVAGDANAGGCGRHRHCSSRSGAVYYNRSCGRDCDRPRVCRSGCDFSPSRPIEPRPLPIYPPDPCDNSFCSSILPPGPVNTGPFFSGQSVYVVLIPNDSSSKLREVRRFVPGAYAAEAIIGPYIRVASYTNHSDAFRLANRLRWSGFDAQIRYLSDHF
jgi:hypothetical protein